MCSKTQVLSFNEKTADIADYYYTDCMQYLAAGRPIKWGNRTSLVALAVLQTYCVVRELKVNRRSVSTI